MQSLQSLTALDPDYVKWVVTLASTLVLFTVFVASAIAFILMIFGVLNPAPAARNFLYTLFAASVVGIFVGQVQGFFNANVQGTLKKIQVDASRQAAVQNVQDFDLHGAQRIVVYTQVDSQADLRRGRILNSALPKNKYDTPAVDNVNERISSNQIRYCNPVNKPNAQALADYLKQNSFNEFEVVKIGNCDEKANLNILEAWIKSLPKT